MLKPKKPLIVCMAILIFIAIVYTQQKEKPQMRLNSIEKPQNKEAARVQIHSTPAYQSKVEAYSALKEAQARNSGASFVPPIFNKKQEPPPDNKPKEPPQKRDPRHTQEKKRPKYDPSLVDRYEQYLQRSLPETNFGRQIYYTQKQDQKPSPTQKKETKPCPLKAGTFLYCINRISLNSDVPGPVCVDVVKGQQAGAKLMGNFEQANTSLRLRFTKLLTKEGDAYSIEAYGVDPETASIAVQGSVDHHYLERFAGLFAASLLEGFGEAVHNTGTITYQTPYGQNRSLANYSLPNQLWMAAGNVGKESAQIFKENLKIRPTIHFPAGHELGVILVAINPNQSSHK